MRNLVWSCLLFCSVLLAVMDGQAVSSDADSRSVRELVAQYMQSRNEKNSKAVSRLFTQDADQLVSTGEWRRGLDELLRGTAASSQKETGRSTITVENIRFIDPDVAIVDGKYQTTSLNGTVRNMWTTLVMKRIQSGWRIAAIRNMLPATASPAR